MKKKPEREDDDMLPEYDAELIRKGVRGKYAQRYREEGTNVVLLATDVAKVFPNSRAVNEALRTLIHLNKTSKPTKMRRAP